jgi:hypothetical protein
VKLFPGPGKTRRLAPLQLLSGSLCTALSFAVQGFSRDAAQCARVESKLLVFPG